MKKTKNKSEFHEKISPMLESGPAFAKSYIIDKGVLTEQLLKDDASNWIIEKGAKMILNGEIPGKNMILLLEHMNILKYKTTL